MWAENNMDIGKEQKSKKKNLQEVYKLKAPTAFIVHIR